MRRGPEVAVRVLLAVVVAVVGVAVSTAAVLLHGYLWGLVLGLVTTVAVFVALPVRWWLSFALGWCAAMVVLAQERPEGDLLMVQDAAGFVMLGACGAVVVAGVVGGVVTLVGGRREAGETGRHAPLS